MASFRTHFSFGILIGIAAIAVATSFALADGAGLFTALFVAAVIGGLMPDMDSDSGVPFHVTFGTLSCIVASLAFLHEWRLAPGEYQTATVHALIAGLFMWLIVGSIFKHFTRHRGMAHSIPAALLAGLVAFLLAYKYGFAQSEAFLLAMALTVGYIGHLVLDEVYAAVNFHGVPFIPNQAFGSALKLFSRDKAANALAYGTLLFLLAGNWSDLSHLAKDLLLKVGG